MLPAVGLIGTRSSGMNNLLGADFQGLEGGLRRPPFSLVKTLARPDLPIGPETLGRIREALAGRGLELCHAGWVPGVRKGKLTLTIDREGGVTLDDCQTASGLADEILEAGDEIPAPTFSRSSLPASTGPSGRWTTAAGSPGAASASPRTCPSTARSG